MGFEMGFEMGLPKCAKGRLVTTGSSALPSGRTVCELDEEDSYRYLGVEQLMGAKLREVKRRIGKKYLKRVRTTPAQCQR